MTLSEQLGEALEQKGLGEYDGDERGPTETILFMYGPDAERMSAVSRLLCEPTRFAKTRVSSFVAAGQEHLSVSCVYRGSNSALTRQRSQKEGLTADLGLCAHIRQEVPCRRRFRNGVTALD